MAIDWNAIYQEELNKIEDPTAGINTLKDADITALTTQKTAQEGTLRQQLEDTMRQAYITQELAKRDMPLVMANQGLNGGITETAYSDVLSDYRNSRNAANKSYDTSYTDLNNTYNNNVATINSDYGKKILDALDARRTTATGNANLRVQIQQAEEAAKLAREQWEWQKTQAEKAAAGAATGGPSGPEAPKPEMPNNLGSAWGTSAWGGSTPTAADAKSRYGQGYRGLTYNTVGAGFGTNPKANALTPRGVYAETNIKTGATRSGYRY